MSIAHRYYGFYMPSFYLRVTLEILCKKEKKKGHAINPITCCLNTCPIYSNETRSIFTWVKSRPIQTSDRYLIVSLLTWAGLCRKGLICHNVLRYGQLGWRLIGSITALAFNSINMHLKRKSRQEEMNVVRACSITWRGEIEFFSRPSTFSCQWASCKTRHWI